MTTLLTLALDDQSQAHFEALRQEHYPRGLNRIPAHLSLFHQLPGEQEVGEALREAAAGTPSFSLQVTGLRSLGRGVAYLLVSPELMRLHAELSRCLEPHLIAQDRQRFQPHIVVQNKATSEQSRELLAALQAGFAPSTVQAAGLLWWEYLGGPWRLLERFPFAAAAATTPE